MNIHSQLSAESRSTNIADLVGNKPLSRRQVGGIFGVHAGTVKRWEKEGRLPPLVINSRVIRYLPGDVMRLLSGARIT